MGCESITVEHGKAPAPLFGTSTFCVPDLVSRDGVEDGRLVSSSMGFRDTQNLGDELMIRSVLISVLGDFWFRVLYLHHIHGFAAAAGLSTQPLGPSHLH